MVPLSFEQELKELLHKHSKENLSDTPDFLLAEFLTRCLSAWNETVRQRDRWYGFKPDHRHRG